MENINDISRQDRDRLRWLAGRQAELAAGDEMSRLYRDWMAHGTAGERRRPMVRIELGTFEQDILPPLYQCQGEAARCIERRLLHNIVCYELFGDDTLVPDTYTVAAHAWLQPFGLRVKRKETGGVGHQFIPYLHDLREDVGLLGLSTMGYHDGEDEAGQADALFGDLLPVRRTFAGPYACPMQDIVHIMNMDDMFMAMHDEPDLFRDVLDRLTDDYLALYQGLERQGVLISAARGEHLCQGSYCFTDTLPDGKREARMTDMWLYMDSQETTGVSPDMYNEVVFPSYLKLMRAFGLVSYGCCEAVDQLWERSLSRVQNLRKVSVSPWCDEEAMGRHLRGTDIVYLRKPTPNLLGVGTVLDEDAVLKHLSATGRAARGCKLEIAQRDVYRIGGTADKVRRYVALIRQALDSTWSGAA